MATKMSEPMTCPRCGYQAEYFDQLAMQPNHLPLEQLLPVHKCPSCKHLFALVPPVSEMQGKGELRED